MRVWRWLLCGWMVAFSAECFAQDIHALDEWYFDGGAIEKSDDFSPICLRTGDDRYILAFYRLVKTSGVQELWYLNFDGVLNKKFAQKITGPQGGGSLRSLRGGSKRFFAGYLSWYPTRRDSIKNGRVVYINDNILMLGQVNLGAGTSEHKKWIDLGVNNLRTDWSSDNLVVFVSELSGQGDLYVAKPPAGLPVVPSGRESVVRLTANDYLDSEPAWSPDGNRLAYTAEPDNNKDIFVIDDVWQVMSSKKPVVTGRKLADLPTIEANPVWSPNGDKIAFYALDLVEEESDDLFGDGETKKKLSDTAKLMVINADGSGLKQLAGNVIRHTEQGPAWLYQVEHQNKIVYVELTQSGTALYVIDVISGSKRRVVVDHRLMSDVACIPGGTYPVIALSALDSKGSKRIYLKRLEFK